MKVFYKLLSTKLSFVCFLIGMLFIHTGVFAQGIAVSGTVTDNENMPVPGVNIMVKGTMTGTASDANGRYNLTAPSRDAVLVFTFVGYATQEIVVGNNNIINVTMLEDTRQMEEVVVVGYGVQRKVTVTGAVSTMRSEEIKASPTTNLSNSIVGRMAGVIGFQRSDEPGGGGTTLRIRGTSTQGYKDPLYVIDGIPDRDGGFNRINPGDIESISILKDASAAIYGSRAANGVVLITTRRGSEGKPTITYSGAYGFSQPTKLPKMCNSFEYATLVNEIDQYYKGTTGRYSDEDLRKYKDGSDPWGHPNTNYMKDAISSASPYYRHELGVSGGTERVRYFTNLSAVGEDGIFKNGANRLDNYSIRTNLDVKINDYINISYGNGSRIEAVQYPAWSADNIFTSLVRSKPTDHGFYPNGQPAPDLEYGHQPVVMATKMTGLDDQKMYYIQNDLKAVVKIPGVEGLVVSTTFSYDKYMKTRKLFRTPFTLYQWTGTDAHETIPVTRGGGDGYVVDLTQELEDRTSWSNATVVNYDFSIGGSHNIGLMAGMEANHKKHNFMLAYRKDFLSDALDELDNGPLDERKAEGYSWEEARLNYFGRVTYNYQERYLFEFVGRYDGSYRFPKENRYGFFPGVSAAWRVSEENFWNRSVVNFFKVRASVAQTGMDYLLDNDGNLDRSVQFRNTYQFGTEYLLGLGSSFNKTLRPARTPNPNITWEKQNEYNLGIELKFLKNRLSFESDIYLRKRSNMLRYRSESLPESSGITLPRENMGEMSNRGIELLLRWDDRKGDFNYYAVYNMTYSKDKLDFIDEQPGIPDYQRATGKVDGAELYYKVDGVFKDQAAVDAYPHWDNAKPGDVRFVDVNGDKKITGDDRVRINKRKEPLFVAGFTLGADWKGFDARIFIQGAAGGITYIYRERAGESGNFFKETFDHRWTAANPSDIYPRIYNREEPYWASEGSSRRNEHFIRSTDYIRLKNAEIGYSFGSLPFIKGIGIQNLRVYARGMNLITLDKIKIQDPEQNNASKDYMQRRYFDFGLTLTF